jgi:hypothetical protein
VLKTFGPILKPFRVVYDQGPAAVIAVVSDSLSITLRFSALSQQLAAIECDFPSPKCVFTYQNAVFSSPAPTLAGRQYRRPQHTFVAATTPTLRSVYSRFGPTFPGTIGTQPVGGNGEGMTRLADAFFILCYPGIQFYFGLRPEEVAARQGLGQESKRRLVKLRIRPQAALELIASSTGGGVVPAHLTTTPALTLAGSASDDDANSSDMPEGRPGGGPGVCMQRDDVFRADDRIDTSLLSTLVNATSSDQYHAAELVVSVVYGVGILITPRTAANTHIPGTVPSLSTQAGSGDAGGGADSDDSDDPGLEAEVQTEGPVGVTAEADSTCMLRLHSSPQDVISLLGQPSRVFVKEEDKLAIHRPGSAGLGDYFFNYFTLGIDVLFDSERHSVTKIILHANAPGDAEFGMYEKCQFSGVDVPWSRWRTVIGKQIATKPLLYEKVRLFGLYNGLGGIAEVDGAVARMTLSIPPP